MTAHAVGVYKPVSTLLFEPACCHQMVMKVLRHFQGLCFPCALCPAYDTISPVFRHCGVLESVRVFSKSEYYVLLLSARLC